MFRTILALALFLAPGVAHADWYEASTEHFVVYSEDKPERLKIFAGNLERFDKAVRYLRQYQDIPPGKANRVTVYVVDNVDMVARLARDDNVAGFYSARASGPVAFVPRVAGTEKTELSALQVLLHEYTHHLMFSIGPNAAYPRWFSEGFAEFHATARFEKDGSVVIGEPPQYRGEGLLHGVALPMQKLLQADTLKLDEEQTDVLYGRGWLLTHYLTFNEKRKGQLTAYLKAINDRKGPLEAATAFGDLRVLDRELDRYTLSRFAALRIGAAALPIGEVAMRKLGTGEAATMDVRIRSKAGVDEKTAPAVYAAARKACAPYPNDAAAQLVLTEAAFDAGDYAGAEAAADRAIAADPGTVRAYTYKAQVRMALAEKAKDQSKETWTALRRFISTANKLDTEDPMPLLLFFESYVGAGIAPPKSAREALYYAFVLAPYDDGLRLSAAAAYLGEGNTASARELLVPLAADPHNRNLAEVATKMIAEIDAGNLKDARKDGETARHDEDAASH